jgi:replicative DNA helicase
MFVGALMYSSVAEVNAVARFVEADDLDQPAATILASIRALAGRGVPPGPVLVKDDLHRRGKLTRGVATWLAAAATSGACSSAARSYAACVLAEAFRRQVESFAAALVSAAPSAAEGEVARLAEQASARIRYTFGRLTELRGDAHD